MREGFVRVINRSGGGGEVTVVAVDDAGWRSPVLTLAVAADETVHFNSNDLEQGNPDKGLSGGTGAPTQGDWRLVLTSDLDFEVLAYIRTADGFLTAMHDVVERGLAGGSLQPGSTTGHPSHEHLVAIFNTGRNKNQVSLMRLINPGTDDADVTITGIDDAGAASTGRETGAVWLTLTAGVARTISAADLESAGERGKEASDGGDSDAGDPFSLTGELGAGTCKWQLLVTSEKPVVVMSLLTADATVTVAVPQNADIEADETTLTFPPDNWRERQWVTVTTIADTDTNNETFFISHSVDGSDYAGPSVAGVSVTVAEDLESTSPANAADNNEYIVEVTATGGTGTREMTAGQTVTVNVKDETEPSGTPAAPIVLVGTGISGTVTQAFQDAATHWEQIVIRSLPDIDFSGQPEVTDTVDDLRVYDRVTEIDATGGTLAAASVCYRRDASTLTVIGKVILDAHDMAARSASDVESIILHEIGHTLGIGTLWHHHDLLKKPALDPDDEDVGPVPDTYFSGALATAAFDAAAGMDHEDNKVPVHNTGGEGSADGYWRESALDNELTSPYFRSGQTEPLSAITVQSLADMGYVVDVSRADSHMLPAATSRMPGLVPKAAGISVPLNCRIEPSVGTVEDGAQARHSRAPVALNRRMRINRTCLSGAARFVGCQCSRFRHRQQPHRHTAS